MSHVGPETFLDIITLTIASPLPEMLSKDQVATVCKKMLELIKEVMTNEDIYDNEENKYFFDVAKNIVDEGITVDQKTKLGTLASKWLKKFPSEEDHSLKRIFTSIILPDDVFDPKLLYEIFDRLKQQLGIMIGERGIKKLGSKVRKAAKTSDTFTQQVTMEELLQNAKAMIEEIKEVGKLTSRSLNVEFIDLSDPSSVQHALAVNKIVRKTTIFKFGLQGFNDMLTEDGGMTLGETVLLAAMSHHYKSGALMDVGRAIAMYTEPPRLDDLQPVIVFISLENEGHKNLINLYRRAYAQEFGGEIPEDATDEEISKTVTQLFARKGWAFHIIRRVGEFFTFEDYLKIVEDYKKKGMRVYVNIIDYPALMNLGGTNENTEGSSMRAKALQQLFHRFANFAKHENILNVFAHQLDTQAAGIVASKVANPVKKFHGRFHLADCKAIYNEVDLLILLCVETNTNGQKFLTAMWSKHRDNIAPPPDKQFCAYPFTSVGIMDDIDKPESQAVYDIYSYRPGVSFETVEDESIFN